MTVPIDVYAQAVAGALSSWRTRTMPRPEVLLLLHELGLDDDEAELVLAHGVAAGILRDGSSVRAL